MTTLSVTVGEESRSKTLMVSFMVVELPLAYNTIIGQPTLNKLKVVVSTYHRAMKFSTKVGVGEARSDPRECKHCYLTATMLLKKLKTPTSTVDPRDPDKGTLNPELVENVVEALPDS
ncbi:hypothetical protein BHM03_00031644 [Ensete ventricosum]|nr:hypothetical protein BHM03_00031644 [Ensete ventricosum]